jgi:HEAT repeat protein
VDPLVVVGLAVSTVLAALMTAGQAYFQRRLTRYAEAAWRAGETSGLKRLAFQPADDEREPATVVVVGDTDGLLVRFDVSGSADIRTRILIAEQRPGVAFELHASGLTVRREGRGTALLKRTGFREVEIGDDGFDEAVFIEGPPTLARAVLDAETRPIVYRALVEGKVRRSQGSDWLDTADFAYEAGVLRTTATASSPSALEALLPEALGALVDLARRLMRPADIAERLARTARAETMDAARVHDLRTLLREFPEHYAARAALQSGLADRNDEIRLLCAMAVGENGRDVLLALATEPQVGDSCAARALAAARHHLTVDQLQAILKQALRNRRPLVAGAALEAIGRSRAPGIVPVLVHVLREGRGSLPVAAAQALALSGLPAAEAPLLEALAGDDRDVCLAAAQALGHVGSTAAIPPLTDARARHGEREFDRVVRQAIAEIQSRAPGASPGQLSLAEANAQAGQLALADDETGRLSLTPKPPS